jgi:hypothetical protein
MEELNKLERLNKFKQAVSTAADELGVDTLIDYCNCIVGVLMVTIKENESNYTERQAYVRYAVRLIQEVAAKDSPVIIKPTPPTYET